MEVEGLVKRYTSGTTVTALDRISFSIAPGSLVAVMGPSGSGKSTLRELLAAVGLGGREDALPCQLSGGEQQRVAIARALVFDPMLLLADEPTGSLDSRTGAEMMDLLVGLRERRGMTLIVATHDPVVASACERIIRLKDGRIVDELQVPETVAVEEVLERIGRLDATA